MPASLFVRLDHEVAPGESAEVAHAVGEILARPCFAALTRVAIHIRDRDMKHTKKTATTIAEYLLDESSDAAVLDSGRNSELEADANIWTGRHLRYYDRKAFLWSYVIVPFDPERAEDVLAAFFDLACTLEPPAGRISVEPSFDLAHRAALSRPPNLKKNPWFPKQRARERMGHHWHDDDIDRQIAGPEWGMFLGRQHLHALPADVIEATGAFHKVLRLRDDLIFLQLTPEPADALRSDFDQSLERARQALAPLLMDLGDVPVQ